MLPRLLGKISSRILPSVIWLAAYFDALAITRTSEPMRKYLSNSSLAQPLSLQSDSRSKGTTTKWLAGVFGTLTRIFNSDFQTPSLTVKLF